jgi:DNA-binding transcriptional MerR regulator
MEMKVRAVESVEEKSMQEVEKELLDKHEKKLIEEDEQSEETPQIKMDFANDSVIKDTTKVEETSEEYTTPVEKTAELSEEDVLSYIGKRYGREINSLDELNQAREETEKLPEDVASYFKYKKETGRGIEDYVKLQKDFSSMNPDDLLREYITITEGEGLDSEDIDSLMEDYESDEELDDESVVKKTKLAKKRTIAKAKKFFNEQKELYKHPLESRPGVNSESDNEEFKAYKQYLESAKTTQEENETKKDWFTKKTNEVFDGEFKGFEFTINDKQISFSPGDPQTLKKNQDTPMNFINKYLDENGLVKNAAGYHRSLAIAMNPDKFANFFYEQGKSEATEDVMRKTKNINMSERRAPEITNKGGMTVKSINPDSGRGLKIRSIKRK